MRKLFFLFVVVVIIILAFLNLRFFDSINVFNSEKTTHEIYIDLEENKLYLFENDNLYKWYYVAAGKSDTPSPIGVWKIDYKAPWGEGFGGRFMKINVPWGTYGIHGTKFPNSIGKFASHGCIRMNNDDVIEVYDRVAIGTKVIITNGIYGPFYREQRVIKPGDRGTDILAVQNLLKKLGYYKGPTDGIYGISLQNALVAYQKDHVLEIKITINNWDLKTMGFVPFE